MSDEVKTEDRKPDEKPAPRPDPPAAVETAQEIVVNGETLRYRVTAGTLPIVDDVSGETQAHVFFMAYTLETDTPRPLMFSFNGGPGSASVWLHLGTIGTKRVVMADDSGAMPAPPYRATDNPHTWLPFTDVVFVDPVGTGYSRPTKPEHGKKFWSVQGDIESLAAFIRLYLVRYERWSSPLYLVGESYGTTRGAGIASFLLDRGIALSGIVLVSAVMQFATLEFDCGNDVPYPLYLPTYAATAAYHGKLAPELCADLAGTLAAAEAFAEGAYTVALQKGDRLGGDERAAVIAELSRFTGLSETFLDDCDARPEIQRFCKELLRRERKTVGRLDSRYTGTDAANGSDTPDYDAALAVITPVYTAAFNDYIRRELGYRTDDEYHILGTGIREPWDWQSQNKYVETASALQSAMAKNPHVRVFVASGYYDLATPYFATEYTLSHMNLSKEARARITTRYYHAGHMMYVHAPSLARLQAEVRAFVQGA